MVQDFVAQISQTYAMAWDKIQTEVSDHVLLAVGFVAGLFLVWFFISPGIKDK